MQKLAAEMETIEDKGSARYKKLSKMKRSQEDRLMTRNEGKRMALKLEMMDSAISMLIKETKASQSDDKARR